jgi:hypothetical protein
MRASEKEPMDVMELCYILFCLLVFGRLLCHLEVLFGTTQNRSLVSQDVVFADAHFEDFLAD